MVTDHVIVTFIFLLFSMHLAYVSINFMEINSDPGELDARARAGEAGLGTSLRG